MVTKVTEGLSSTFPKKGAILTPDPGRFPTLAAGRGPRRIRCWPARLQAPAGGRSAPTP
ncbi:hypothetical protein [Azospirillum doebereinerae]